MKLEWLQNRVIFVLIMLLIVCSLPVYKVTTTPDENINAVLATQIAPTSLASVNHLAPQTVVTTDVYNLTQSPEAPDEYEEVKFVTEDGVLIAGTLIGDGPNAVILAPMINKDQKTWMPFAERISDEGVTALTIDFRGTGKSEGAQDRNAFGKDILGAISFLRSRGYSKIVCIGASIGGTACAKNSDEAEIIGMALISSPKSGLSEKNFNNTHYPKLFIVSENDKDFFRETQQMFDWAIEPKRMFVFTGGSHGTYLFKYEHAKELIELLLSFILSLP